MRLRLLDLTIPLLALLSFVQPSIAQDSAALDRFVGTWKEDESKRDLSGQPPLVFRQGAKNIEELRGGEVSPIVMQVVFDGKPYVVDGNASTAWRQLDANRFERRLTEDGKLVTVRTLTISGDGKTLTEKTDQTRVDGKPRSVTTVYQRLEGGNGLVGRWKAQSLKSTLPQERSIQRTGPNAIKLTTALGVGFTAALDGKPVQETGPGVITGTMRTARLAGDRTIAMTTMRNGKELSRTELTLSADGKTLTESQRSMAPNASGTSVSVFTKQ